MANEAYSSFHTETVETIASYSEKIIGVKSSGFSLFDLGPGYPDKAIPLAKFCKTNSIDLEDYPVDISEEFLKLASKEMAPYSKSVFPIHARFEDLLPKIKNLKIRENSLFMIGLTFMNFEPDLILSLLKRLARAKSKILLATEILSSDGETESIVSKYSIPQAKEVAFGPLAIMGIKRKSVKDIVLFANGRIEMSFKLLTEPPLAAKLLGVKTGDTITTAISYRYKIEELNQILNRYFQKVELFKSKAGSIVVALAHPI